MAGMPVVPIDTRSDQDFLKMAVDEVEPSLVILSKEYSQGITILKEKGKPGYIYIEDVEEEIKDCAVFGMDSDGRKEIIAVLLLKDKDTGKENIDAIVNSVNKDLNVDQKVDDYIIWEGEDFPRTPTMNIKKREILEKLQESTRSKKIEFHEDGKDIFSIIQKIKKTWVWIHLI